MLFTEPGIRVIELGVFWSFRGVIWSCLLVTPFSDFANPNRLESLGMFCFFSHSLLDVVLVDPAAFSLFSPLNYSDSPGGVEFQEITYPHESSITWHCRVLTQPHVPRSLPALTPRVILPRGYASRREVCGHGCHFPTQNLSAQMTCQQS
jgi:hypothetical protein